MTNFVAAFALIISVVGISLTAIVQVKSEAHDKELYQKFKQDIDNEVADMRDLLRQHIMLSDREEQLKPLGLGKRNKTLGTVIDGVECFAGNAIGCAKTVDDVIDDF
jgi:Holliday junction resolvase RusA-like endonuclease